MPVLGPEVVRVDSRVRAELPLRSGVWESVDSERGLCSTEDCERWEERLGIACR